MGFPLSRRTRWLTSVACLALFGACDRLPSEPTPQVCQYSVAPTEFTVCMAAPGDLTMNVYATAECPWRVTSAVPWIAVTANQSGNGPGMSLLRVSDNWDAPRDGVVTLHGELTSQAVTARVAQAGCVYWVSKDTVDFGASGGAGVFDVLQQSLPISCGGPRQDACVWSADTDAPWITVTSGNPQTGDAPVAFTVAPNHGAARTGTITVRDKVVRINQAGS